MSVVAVKIHKNKITIGADSQITHGWILRKNAVAKLLKVNNLVIGGSGRSRDFTLLTLFSRNHEPKSATELDIVEYLAEFVEWCRKRIDGTFVIDSSFIIIFQKKVFKLDHDFMVYEINDFHAIGSGEEFALAALHLGKSVEKAIEAACEFSIYCAKPINIIEVEL